MHIDRETSVNAGKTLINIHIMGDSKLTELLEHIQIAVNNAKDDLEKFVEKKNASAGTRVRKEMQSIKGLAQELRLAVQAAKKA